MIGFAIVNKGGEDVSELEIRELINPINIDKRETILLFKFEDYLDLCRLCYKSQSISRAGLLLFEFNVFETLEETIKEAEKFFKIDEWQISRWLKKNFSVFCTRFGYHQFSSVDLASEFIKRIAGLLKMSPDYDNPDLLFYLYIYEGKGYFGVDFGGFDLSKRQYKIFNHPEAIKGNVAYILIREAFQKGHTLIDPFMGSGVVAIEAAIYETGFPVRYYEKEKLAFSRLFDCEKFFKKEDKFLKKPTLIYGYDSQLKYLKAAQKNSKLAGIDKYINLSKVDVEWLDTKFKKESVDCIITDPPRSSREENKLLKMYNEFFYQSAYILKKAGKIAIFCRLDELVESSAKNNNFKIKKKYQLYQGKEPFWVLVFEK